tara:strand:+ start:147 stop:284 length:138 start_codon:yes stop_codon:yes gene_type:complete
MTVKDKYKPTTETQSEKLVSDETYAILEALGELTTEIRRSNINNG